MKPPLSKCKKMLDDGYSLLTVGKNNTPNIKSWKPLQQTPWTKEEFEQNYNRESTLKIGYITGVNDLEVIDIDLKIFDNLKEQTEFWNEYISFLTDNIPDFKDKFVIYKTINNGYHIIYKCKKIDGNRKLAKLEGYKEAIIETRGNGGFCFMYDKQISLLNYSEVQEISELDRDILISCSESYDFKEPEPLQLPNPVKKQYNNKNNTLNITPWEDYNKNQNILDLISLEFKVVSNLTDKYLIKRNGAKSHHSGYVYKNSNCMYLFSTGTQYPHEKLLSSYEIYTIQNHNGNFSASAKDLYSKNYGSRVVKEPTFKKIETKIKKEELIFPLDIFPQKLKDYILQSHSTLSNSIDYMGVSMLWLVSLIIGNSFNLKVKTGWKETVTLWISVVGDAGVGKTPSINSILFPLKKINTRQIKRFIKETEKYEIYNNLSAVDKKIHEKVSKPHKTQFIVNDITIEALVELHEESKNSIGVFKDELAGWIKDMNKYRAGSDLEFWLSSWSGETVALTRKTSRSSFIEKPSISVLGGIQPSILDSFNTDENKDNGFLDRLLLCYPDLKVENYKEIDISQDVLDWYENVIINFYDVIRSNIIYNTDDEISPVTIEMSPDAKKEWIRIFNNITSQQNSDSENEYMKTMLPKQKSYIPRFILLLHIIDTYFNNKHLTDNVSKGTILKAEKLSKYFIAMAKKIKIQSFETKEIKKVTDKQSDKSSYDIFKDVYMSNKDVSKTKLANILNISRQQIYRYIKQYES